MTDPFNALGGHTNDSDTGPGAITPPASFAEQLRRRVEAELRGAGSDADDRPYDDAPSSAGYLFYFTLPAPDADSAARFYRELFGWELHQGDSGHHVANVYPPMGLASEATDPQVWIEVDDMEAAVARVRAAGGQTEEPVVYDSGLNAVCTDDQGVVFNLIVPTEEYRQGQARSTKPGELFYWNLPAPDPERSKAFYRRVFGWEYSDAGDAGGLHVTNKLPDGGLGGGREGTHPEVFFRVADLDTSMAKVIELGGTATFVGAGPEGRHAMCVDDQGIAFGISQESVVRSAH